MSATFQFLLNGDPADDALLAQMGTLEIEENADLPGAIQLTLPVDSDGNGDLTYVNDPRFQPFSNLAVVVTPAAGGDECIFDGYVLSNKLHLQKGTTGSTLQVWGQDASWLMNLQENAKEWVDVTDADVANSIFGNYGITPADDNTDDDSPSHTEDTHTLMQRASDIQFLRLLARRNGKLCRVACTDTPGDRTGYFAKPDVDGDPVVTLELNDPTQWTVETLDFEWDVSRPTEVQAAQALFNDSDEDGVSVDQTDSGLDPLDDQDLAAFSGKSMTVMLTAPVDSADELTLRAESVLREAGWFVRCTGQADVSRLNAVLRVGTVVQINGAGALNSGNYFVWSVRHSIDKQAHKMNFILVRNAVGTPPAGGSSVLGGLP
ncbi:MAG TPA: contractile injection system protein, VgrG/Pvc8 family [Terriglobales bacterium]|jgi:phage protein D|nr:contractile injection system protein, VgrG/Pvc8 family [Terriglobales bacterium]